MICSSQGQSEAAQLLATFWPRQMQEIRNMSTVSTLTMLRGVRDLISHTYGLLTKLFYFSQDG